jgi:spermidine/putrescine transport system permease protein
MFLYIPIIINILGSLSSQRYTIDLTHMTFEWYYKAFSNKEITTATINSLLLSVTSAVIASVLGFLTGYAYMMRKPGGFVETVIYIPIIIPEIIEAFTLATFYISLGVEMGFYTVLIGHLTFNIAYAFVILRSRLEMISRELIDVAKSLGAGEITVIIKVILPISYPAILSAALLTFALSFDDLVKTLFTTGPGFKTLPILIWSMTGRGGISPQINAITAVILIISLTSSLLISYILRRELIKTYY